MEERKETEQEFYDNTQLLLSKINLDVDKTEVIFNKIAKALGKYKLYEAYLPLMYMCKHIEDFLEMNEEDKAWFAFTADRCLKLRKDRESENSCEGIN